MARYSRADRGNLLAKRLFAGHKRVTVHRRGGRRYWGFTPKRRNPPRGKRVYFPSTGKWVTFRRK